MVVAPQVLVAVLQRPGPGLALDRALFGNRLTSLSLLTVHRGT
jgi:hypothetical protein